MPCVIAAKWSPVLANAVSVPPTLLARIHFELRSSTSGQECALAVAGCCRLDCDILIIATYCVCLALAVLVCTWRLDLELRRVWRRIRVRVRVVGVFVWLLPMVIATCAAARPVQANAIAMCTRGTALPLLWAAHGVLRAATVNKRARCTRFVLCLRTACESCTRAVGCWCFRHRHPLVQRARGEVRTSDTLSTRSRLCITPLIVTITRYAAELTRLILVLMRRAGGARGVLLRGGKLSSAVLAHNTVNTLQLGRLILVLPTAACHACFWL